MLDRPADLDQLVDLYDQIVRTLVEKHVPFQRETLLIRALVPWFSNEIQAAKRYRRYCERFWVRTHLFVHYEIFKIAKINVRNILAAAKSQYYNNKIDGCGGNQKTAFWCCK